jgi:hypothetical protein
MMDREGGEANEEKWRLWWSVALSSSQISKDDVSMDQREVSLESLYACGVKIL